MPKKRVLLVGGVAGGASCAARVRRLSEEAEIIIFEQGPYVSFANCGLPYYVGGVITKEESLLVASPELFKKRFNIDVRVENQVISLDRKAHTIQVKDLKTGSVYTEAYDALLLSPGGLPIRPPLPGVDLPGIFVVRTIPDSRQIREWIVSKKVKKAVVVGGGFIGLEMAENLAKRRISVSIIEMLPQVMPPVDPEMAAPIHEHLKSKGLSLFLGDAVTGFEQKADGTLAVNSKSGESLPADLIILSIGVRPEVSLAKAAGLEIGDRGGISVNKQMQTSDRRIWAVGDAVEVQDAVTGEAGLIPLAGPANRQGRIAADAICGRDTQFRGVQGTSVCGIFDLTVAMTGANEKTLARLGRQYEKIYLHPNQHVGYYPGAKQMTMKLLFDPDDGRLLGMQALGEEGVERRIDVIAMAIQKKATVFDLEEAELCYAPQFGAAKDPVNFAGMIAANVLRGDMPLTHWADIIDPEALVLDVRDQDEVKKGQVEGAMHIPLPELRDRLGELPRDREILSYCSVGQRSYYALRILLQNGFKARNLSGGFIIRQAVKK